MTCRSAMKSAIPIRIRITPIAEGITNIAAVPCGRSIGLQMKIASSLTSDCTAHRGGDGFIQPYGSPSSLH